MATYECAKCGMAVNAFCAKCETALENDFVTSDEGKKIQVSVCPNGHGKIKSPTCCGADMDCKGWSIDEWFESRRGIDAT